jgi:carboxylesterase type B
VKIGKRPYHFQAKVIDDSCSLTLDIWVPPTASSGSQLPVKVWIFGGAGAAGGISDPLYNGCNLASDAIVVSINYRVGLLGFLSLPSAGIQGNMAVQDVVLGLEWVQANIASFGGDPVSHGL